MPGREEQATAQEFAAFFASPARLARQAGLRVCSRRHLQPVCGGRAKRRAADVVVTDHRAKTDFVAFVQHLLKQVYATARRIHLVMDNLNTHFRKCFEEVLGVEKAKALLRRVVFHYMPKHAIWLNMAEIEIGILDRQCLDRRLPDQATLITEVNAWQLRRNTEQRGIEWSFTRQDADTRMARHYVS